MLATPDLIREASLPERLVELLPRWLREVPLYERSIGAPSLTETTAVPEMLRGLPLITKEDIRRNFPLNFLRAGVDLESLLDQDLVEVEHTSGTSEERTPLLLARGWWAAQEQEALRLNPLVASVLDEFPAARRVTINSPVCSNDISYVGTPSRADRTVGNALFVSLSRFPLLWGETDLKRMAAEAVQWAPQFLDVDPVYGVVFALYCERQNIRLPSLRFIICSYEFVSVAHRRILERVFGVPVFNLYGSTETGHLLMETEHGEMRPSLGTAFLETLDTDSQGIGGLAVTTLTNDFMPLIRYRIGDLVERLERPYWTSFLVHGRTADAFATPTGGRITTRQIDACFADMPGVAHYQLRAEQGGALSLRFVTDVVPPSAANIEKLHDSLVRLLGITDSLAIEQTDLLMPESSGKFRLGVPGPV